jgi:hypothetical protein
MNTLNNMMNEFLTATPEEQAQFLKLARGVKRSAAKEQVDNGGAERRLYDSLAHEFMSLVGIRIPPYDMLCKGSDARVRLETAVRWLTHNPHGVTLTRSLEQALFGLAASAVAHETQHHTALSKAEVLMLLTSIPRATDRAFPGYRANGLLLRIAQKAAQGLLPLERLPEEEEWAA